MTELAFLKTAARPIAYRLRAGGSPTLVFLCGYASDMEGTKALILDGLAKDRGQALLRFDYSGTGSSPGQLPDGNVEMWVEDALAVIDEVTDGPLLVVGSSLGGWIGLHVARLRPDRVQAFVGIAAAPDFTDWGFTEEQRTAGAPMFQPHFFAAGDRMALLRDEIAIDCPVRLIHGEADQQVPYDVGLRTLVTLRSDDVQLTLIKGGGHRLTEPHEIATILDTISDLLEPTA